MPRKALIFFSMRPRTLPAVVSAIGPGEEPVSTAHALGAFKKPPPIHKPAATAALPLRNRRRSKFTLSLLRRLEFMSVLLVALAGFKPFYAADHTLSKANSGAFQ